MSSDPLYRTSLFYKVATIRIIGNFSVSLIHFPLTLSILSITEMKEFNNYQVRFFVKMKRSGRYAFNSVGIDRVSRRNFHRGSNDATCSSCASCAVCPLALSLWHRVRVKLLADQLVHDVYLHSRGLRYRGCFETGGGFVACRNE